MSISAYLRLTFRSLDRCICDVDQIVPIRACQDEKALEKSPYMTKDTDLKAKDTSSPTTRAHVSDGNWRNSKWLAVSELSATACSSPLYGIRLPSPPRWEEVRGCWPWDGVRFFSERLVGAALD